MAELARPELFVTVPITEASTVDVAQRNLIVVVCEGTGKCAIWRSERSDEEDFSHWNAGKRADTGHARLVTTSVMV
jgi:hypothetical protein